MKDLQLDGLARQLGASTRTRRGLFGLLALLLGGERAAAQNTSSCAGDGQMCALGMPCCSGFVCQSSFINPTFGSCVTGTSTTGTGFSYPGVADATTTTDSTEKGPGGRRHRISERKHDRDRKRRKRKARRRESSNNKSKNNGNNNNGNNNNGGSSQGFQDDYMVTASALCTGTGSTDAVTIRNTGSQTLSIAKIEGKKSGEPVFNPATPYVLKPNDSNPFFDGSDASIGTDFLLNLEDEYAIITAWRGDGTSPTPGDPLIFRAFCDGKKSKRIK